MTKLEFEKALAHYKKGTYIRMIWRTVSENGHKISSGIIRITNPEVKTNKEGIDYALFRITKNNKLRAKVHYYNLSNEEITKEEYAIGNEIYNITDFFAKHLEDIIQLGKGGELNYE